MYALGCGACATQTDRCGQPVVQTMTPAAIVAEADNDPSKWPLLIGILLLGLVIGSAMTDRR